MCSQSFNAEAPVPESTSERSVLPDLHSAPESPWPPCHRPESPRSQGRRPESHPESPQLSSAQMLCLPVPAPGKARLSSATASEHPDPCPAYRPDPSPTPRPDPCLAPSSSSSLPEPSPRPPLPELSPRPPLPDQPSRPPLPDQPPKSSLPEPRWTRPVPAPRLTRPVPALRPGLPVSFVQVYAAAAPALQSAAVPCACALRWGSRFASGSAPGSTAAHSPPALRLSPFAEVTVSETFAANLQLSTWKLNPAPV